MVTGTFTSVSSIADPEEHIRSYNIQQMDYKAAFTPVSANLT
jgi:hypothetical protein